MGDVRDGCTVCEGQDETVCCNYDYGSKWSLELCSEIRGFNELLTRLNCASSEEYISRCSTPAMLAITARLDTATLNLLIEKTKTPENQKDAAGRGFLHR